MKYIFALVTFGFVFLGVVVFLPFLAVAVVSAFATLDYIINYNE